MLISTKDRWMVYLAIGNYLETQGRLEEAHSFYKLALKFARKVGASQAANCALASAQKWQLHANTKET